MNRDIHAMYGIHNNNTQFIIITFIKVFGRNVVGRESVPGGNTGSVSEGSF